MAYQNPADAAMPYVQEIPGSVSPYYQPYINSGNKAMKGLGQLYPQMLGTYGQLQNEYSGMMQHPDQVLNEVGAGYQESPGYQWQLEQSEDAIGNTAAAGGMVGTPEEQQFAATTANGLANQDYYNYINHALKILGGGTKGEQGLFNQGLSGTQQINQMGYNASDSLAQAIAQSLMEQANLSYAGQANENQHQGGIIGDTLGFASSIVSDIFKH